MFSMHIACDMHTTLYSQYCDMHGSYMQHAHYMQEISTREDSTIMLGRRSGELLLSVLVSVTHVVSCT